MKNNFSLDSSLLEKASRGRSDRLDRNYNYTYRLEHKFTRTGHYSNDVASLIDLGFKHVEQTSLIEFLKNYELVFVEGLREDHQIKHRMQFINELFKRYIMTLIEEKVKQSHIENSKKEEHIIRRTFWAGLSPKQDIWMSLYISKFMEDKRLNTVERLFKYPFILGLSIDCDSKNSELANDYFLESFDMNDLTFSEMRISIENRQIFIGMSGSEIKNYFHLTAPFKHKIIGELDFEDIVQEIKNIQTYIESLVPKKLK